MAPAGGAARAHPRCSTVCSAALLRGRGSAAGGGVGTGPAAGGALPAAGGRRRSAGAELAPGGRRPPARAALATRDRCYQESRADPRHARRTGDPDNHRRLRSAAGSTRRGRSAC